MADVNSTFKVYISTDPVFKVYVNNGAKGDSGIDGIDGQNGEGVASGGFTGQFLIKLSEEDFDTGWSNIDSTQVSYGDGTVSEGLDNRYTKGETDLLLDDKSDVGHTHDDRYFTETEVGVLLSGKSDTSHTHDDRYYTETETDTLLNAKADKLYATNLVANGDFSVDSNADGLADNWVKPQPTNSASIVSGWQRITNVSSNRLELRQTLTLTSGRKYYIRFTFRTNYVGVAPLAVSDNTYAETLYSTLTRSGTFSTVFTPSTTKSDISFRIYNGSDVLVNDYFEFDYITMIDLTATFGIGNEPTATEMDTLLAKFPNSWFNGTNYLADLSEITKLGNSVIQNATEANAKIEASSTGAVITRNVNDANTALKVNQQHASSTGDILKLQQQGTDVFKFSRSGVFQGTYLGNITSTDNSVIWLLSTGTTIQRNIADANPALKVNQANASSTGKILDLQFGGVSKVTVDTVGVVVAPYFKAPYFQNPTSSANAQISLSTIGVGIRRDIADANPALIINQANASSTGNIAEFQFNGTTKLAIDKNGLIPQEAWITPTLLNGWVNRLAERPLRYRKDGFGIVRLSGQVKSGTLMTVIASLPSGYRPNIDSVFAVATYSATGSTASAEITIYAANGNIEVSRGSTIWVSLDGVTFSTT